ncbi:protocatechuate dioxygenase [Streptomyces sp. 7-21]|uniref:protocatechuate dioxygenase n=1 Tax=Streptomyces sp. 7-21 TaxID=2802283 RepID=UPI00191F1308|nr:protocatechuate dioxygenase [Streptomyces sp. 7-21]MBL1065413.1 protocatechuate dioxygenase [Streptomyces sp. 7-21]
MTNCELSRRTVIGFGGAGIAGAVLGVHGGEAAGVTRHLAGETYVLAASPAGATWLPEPGLVRRDITDGKPGVPMELRLAVHREGGGPVAGAGVEVWHCDAWGYYAGCPSGRPGGEVPAAGAERCGADPETYLRGAQRTGSDGTVVFRTIVPGWYGRRAPHVHVVVHEDGFSHTGQLFVGDEVADEVRGREPYRRHGGDGPARLAEDRVYPGGGARGGLLTVERAPGERGYTARAVLGLSAAG